MLAAWLLIFEMLRLEESQQPASRGDMTRLLIEIGISDTSGTYYPTYLAVCVHPRQSCSMQSLKILALPDAFNLDELALHRSVFFDGRHIFVIFVLLLLTH